MWKSVDLLSDPRQPKNTKITTNRLVLAENAYCLLELRNGNFGSIQFVIHTKNCLCRISKVLGTSTDKFYKFMRLYRKAISRMAMDEYVYDTVNMLGIA